MKAIIVEDSRLARLELKKLLESFDWIDIVAESGDPDQAIQLINQLKPELIFLDIQMPGKNGFELLDELSDPPIVIFTTAFDEYALRSFEYDALDYLLKPIDPDRLEKALTKASQLINNSNAESDVSVALDATSSVFIKEGEDCWMVELQKIIYFESIGNYCRVYFDKQQPLIHKSLNQLEKRLPLDLFFRVNRQQMINLKFIQDVVPWFSGNLKLILKNGTEIEVSRRHASRFKNMLSL
ncbi:MAG: DNA-binding response regulator [Gammaproteobacteria bacterium CG22_combo_CG10-13_8_21_14_all_40_8]|nr:MAG: DNA-binding response regulator [Gammaproteobacteria bacterium CG22_combo_CG10-13_8_21_14_all_40_8]